MTYAKRHAAETWDYVICYFLDATKIVACVLITGLEIACCEVVFHSLTWFYEHLSGHQLPVMVHTVFTVIMSAFFIVFCLIMAGMHIHHVPSIFNHHSSQPQLPFNKKEK